MWDISIDGSSALNEDSFSTNSSYSVASHINEHSEDKKTKPFLEAFWIAEGNETGRIIKSYRGLASTTFPDEVKRFVNHVNSFDIEEEKAEKLNPRQISLCRLSDIKDLEQDWDGEGTQPIPGSIIVKATEIVLELMHQPSIFPTGRNSIQLEFELSDGSYLEFEIFDDRITCMSVPHREYDKATFRELGIAERDTIIDIVEEFYGHK